MTDFNFKLLISGLVLIELVRGGQSATIYDAAAMLGITILLIVWLFKEPVSHK